MRHLPRLHKMEETANSQVKIHTVEGMEKYAMRGMGNLVQSWQDSLSYEGLEDVRYTVDGEKSGALVLLWHNRLFPAIGAFRRANTSHNRLHALVSASRDGARISEFLNTLGIPTIRGSSSRRSVTATRELYKVLARGGHVAITVDGPRGPCYTAQPGASFLVQLTEAPVYLMGIECESARELKSWDRFLVPAPFSRVKIKMDRLDAFPREKGKDQRKAIQKMLQERLSGLTSDDHRKA